MEAIQEHRPYHPDFPVTITKSYNLTFMPHWHKEVELAYVVKGKVKIGINQESFILHPGDIAISGSRDIHYYENLQRDTVIRIIIFHPEVIGYPGGWPVENRLQIPYLNEDFSGSSAVNAALRSSIVEKLEDILKEHDLQQDAYPLFIKSRLFEICGILMRHFPSSPIDTREEQHRLHNLKRMQDVLRYIESNYTRQLPLEEVARHAGLSPFHFSRLFKNTMGMPFKHYINRIRINRAENLLQGSDMPITRIAFECGFESIRTFNRVFKSIKGTSPSALR